MVRAYKIAMTPPMEPVLIVLDHDMQLRPLREPACDSQAHDAVASGRRIGCRARSGAPPGRGENPQINAGRLARTPNGIVLLVELAELLQALGQWRGDRVNFPSRHPLAGNGAARRT